MQYDGIVIVYYSNCNHHAKAFGEYVGAAVGGITGNKNDVFINANVALNAEKYNRELHQNQLNKIKALAKGDKEKEERLLAAGCAINHCSAGIPDDDPSKAIALELERKGSGADYQAERTLLLSQTEINYSGLTESPVFHQYNKVDAAIDFVTRNEDAIATGLVVGGNIISLVNHPIVKGAGKGLNASGTALKSLNAETPSYLKPQNSATTVKPSANTASNGQQMAKSNKPEQLQQNKANGAKYADNEFNKFKQTVDHPEQEITAITKSSGTKIRFDAVGINKKTGKVVILETKATKLPPEKIKPTTGLTTNQKKGFPEVTTEGFIIKGSGKGKFTGGTEIKPEQIEELKIKYSNGVEHKLKTQK